MNAIDLPAPEPLEVERVFARLETTGLKRHRDMLLAARSPTTRIRERSKLTSPASSDC